MRFLAVGSFIEVGRFFFLTSLCRGPHYVGTETALTKSWLIESKV